jgi:hypothetical protein
MAGASSEDYFASRGRRSNNQVEYSKPKIFVPEAASREPLRFAKKVWRRSLLSLMRHG